MGKGEGWDGQDKGTFPLQAPQNPSPPALSPRPRPRPALSSGIFSEWQMQGSSVSFTEIKGHFI